MYGENQAEYGNNPEENYIPTMDEKFFTAQDPLKMKLGDTKIEEIIKNNGYLFHNILPYRVIHSAACNQSNDIVPGIMSILPDSFLTH